VDLPRDLEIQAAQAEGRGGATRSAFEMRDDGAPGPLTHGMGRMGSKDRAGLAGRPSRRLTHLDDKGAARMVDVADKLATVREATAESVVRMAPETVRAVREGTAKGDALQVARVAGIMAAKKTADLIPLCHPLPLTSVTVDFEFIDEGVRITTRARVVGQTGVEMEALTAAAVAGLTLIDMTKGVERGVFLETVRLLEKSGGRSGTWKR